MVGPSHKVQQVGNSDEAQSTSTGSGRKEEGQGGLAPCREGEEARGFSERLFAPGGFRESGKVELRHSHLHRQLETQAMTAQAITSIPGPAPQASASSGVRLTCYWLTIPGQQRGVSAGPNKVKHVSLLQDLSGPLLREFPL